MTNDISSQITSTVLNQNRTVESASQSSVAVVGSAVNRQATTESATNRQATDTQLQSGAPAAQSQKAQLEQAVSDINDYVQSVNRELQFRVDEALPLGRSIVTVIDADTEETIREFPSEEALALAHQLRDQAEESGEAKVEGLIISAQA